MFITKELDPIEQLVGGRGFKVRILPFVIGTWVIRRILENMTGPRIEAAMGENLQPYSRRFDLWERWKETFALAKIGPKTRAS